MLNHPLFPLLPALALSACGGSGDQPASNDVTAKTEAATAALNNATAALTSAKPSAPTNCGQIQESKDDENILGIAPGMSPEQASTVLICKGYVATFPVNDDQGRMNQQEAQQGIFRWDFGRNDRRDYVRLFGEGRPGAQQIFYIGRTSRFDENAPTVEAVAQQYVDAYHPPEKPYQNHLGITHVGKVNISSPISGRLSPEATRKHCIDVAFLHDASDRFSTVMNVPPYPDVDCGGFMTLEVIPNGTNENIAYVAHYQLGNPRIAVGLRDQRNSAAQAAQDAQQQAETQDAKIGGQLPDL